MATLPTQGGMEDVVMRLLAHSEPIPIDQLGLLFPLERLKARSPSPTAWFFVRPHRLGQDHHAALHPELHQHPGAKIWTVEDPVEITQKGLRQVQVNRKAGIDFATMMRAFLRADPT